MYSWGCFEQKCDMDLARKHHYLIPWNLEWLALLLLNKVIDIPLGVHFGCTSVSNNLNYLKQKPMIWTVVLIFIRPLWRDMYTAHCTLGTAFNKNATPFHPDIICNPFLIARNILGRLVLFLLLIWTRSPNYLSDHHAESSLLGKKYKWTSLPYLSVCNTLHCNVTSPIHLYYLNLRICRKKPAGKDV